MHIANTLIRHKSVQLTLLVAILGLSTYAFAAPTIPALATVAAQNIQTELFQIPVFLGLAALAYFVTRKRELPNLADRAPTRAVAKTEVIGLIIYAIVAVIGLASLGYTYHPPDVFAAGATFNATNMIIWALLNVSVYVAIPYLYFRWRGTTNAQLGLANNNWRKDVWVILAVGGLDFLMSLGYSGFLALTPTQMVRAAPLTLVLYTFGAGLPIVIMTQAILAPRIMRLTNSYIATTVALTFAYAFFSLTDAGISFEGGLSHALLAMLLILVHNLGPGLIKATITVRTGNAWLHMLAYHVLSFHVIVDSPIVAFLFGF